MDLAKLRRRMRVRRRLATRSLRRYRRQRKQYLEARRSYLKAKRRGKDVLARRALAEAQRLIGVMEAGGNNRGPQIDKIIRENGGAGPEPWCGDFVAHCYRTAGSKSVSRSWAAVRLLSGVSGVQSTTNPKPGDLVRFTFDHVGIFEKNVNGSTIRTIEGNTGASGAVSDSTTGGDGVYRKHRSKQVVRDYLRVTR